MRLKHILTAVVLSLTLGACGNLNTQLHCANQAAKTIPAKPLNADTLALGITQIPAKLAETFTPQLKYNRYTQVLAPNGKGIHIVAQDELTDEQIVRARNILTHYLTDYPGSKFGSNKAAVANSMANNHAILNLMNGSDDGSNCAADLPGQALYADETQVEGHFWYTQQDYAHRDAAFEEILHLVHDTGIGVDGSNSMDGALPEYQSYIRAAQQDASKHHLWGINSRLWLWELSLENSLSQEYLAAVVDTYYGLWGAFSESPTHGMWGSYVAKYRSELEVEDPMGADLMPMFFQPYLTYNARIDKEFRGNFSLKFDPALPYTNHSQYLKDITLLGEHNTHVTVNGFDNHITGNRGINTVVFSGAASDYTVEIEDGTITVADKLPERDGTNTLVGIERLKFSDGSLEISS